MKMWQKTRSLFVVLVLHAATCEAILQVLLPILNPLLDSIIKVLSKNPEVNMATDEIIEFFGYPVENHYVTTEDGYILRCFRIPYGRNNSVFPRKPVILQHGLLSSSNDWVINFPYESLGFILADVGYDVWITNSRGNSYGRNHTTLNPNTDNAFWHFSWDQMAQYDMPAIIDYILNVTNRNQLYYVGHSMGTTIAFAMLSTKTEYNAKIKVVVAMGPGANFTYSKTVFSYIGPVSQYFYLLANVVPGELLPNSTLTTLLGDVCVQTAPEICQIPFKLLFGFDKDQLNYSRTDVYLAHSPAGTSLWTLMHFAQEVEAKRFRHCNWGPNENMQRYNQVTPPDYNVTKITAPVAVFWGLDDILTTPTDTLVLVSALLNLAGIYQIGDENMAHLDFVWAMNSYVNLYPTVIKVLASV